MFIRRFSKHMGLTVILLSGLTGIFYACKTKPVATSVNQSAPVTQTKKPRVLVFTKTKGWFHISIPSGIAALQKMGKENGFDVDTTKNAAYFVEDNLKKYSAVVFLSTTMNVLDPDQQVAFERYIQAGGGFVGIHAAADTEYNWPWYNRLVGAYFASHPNNPNVRAATVDVVDTTHQAMKGLPARWERKDEWYNYKNISPEIKVLATLDETSYEGGTNGDYHPIAWYHDYDGGRAFYTGGGHTDESFSEPLFVKHLLGGIRYAIGEDKGLDYSRSYAVKTPEENRFVKTVLTNDLNEPMELAVAPDGRVFFVERGGKFYVYEPTTKKTKLLRDFPVAAVDKYLNGLLGMSIDPDFNQNHFLYFFYTTSDKGQLKQLISRFVVGEDGNLDLATEKVLIEVPIEAEVSAHTGGSLAWDKEKNLYISTGDNTVPFESNGFAPIDTRSGRLIFDAERSAGNPNDLRGKILRIHPNADGTYTIPQGNLFPAGTPGTRPEIYIMGCRNPYRISVDQATGILYWGEIGPDSGTDGVQGPRGYDEFNQARKAGNFGWPYFVGDNKPYHQYDFATKAVGDLFDPNAPVNNSPNNSGAKNLPPAQKAMIWYPYNKSDEFPELGVGGRCAIGGPVYHYNAQLASSTKIPDYYDKALFVLDWMRNWIFAVRLDENQNFKRMEPFMPTLGDFRRPVDMEIGPDGAFYILEYGSVYGIDNEDARLVKVEFNGGNRAPVARIMAKDTIGLVPLKVAFNGQRSSDPDEEDKLTYEWRFEGNQVASKEANPTYTFEKNGVYKAILKVTDPAGQSSLDTLEIKVGNTLPQVAINTTQNSSFFFAGATPLNYTVDIKDNEDKLIDNKKVQVKLNYIPKVLTNEPLIGHQQITNLNIGKTLMANSDCKACHQIDKKSVGPAFMEVSKKYVGDKTATARLANKVITGGGGVWGDHAMNAHPQLSREEATEIVKYVLSLSVKQPDKKLPAQGALSLKDHVGKEEQGRYILSASYTDKGGAITPLTNQDVLVLRPNRVTAADADILFKMNRQGKRLGNIHNKSYFVLKNIDLKGINQLTYNYASKDQDATIEVHIDSPKGQVISTLNYVSTGAWGVLKEISTPIQDPGGKHDLYFVFVKDTLPNQHLFSLEWIDFNSNIKQ
ncbi:ThuA domain-containing protein [Xanthocytophaga flava]|uniref:ThuA domain-containing protein n=1 Tax=Xanthocytophaga flava TaxID=3048013 RepID=UPI0028D5D18B|nr:ThuA domain-containing protein [Xanthocytophaga flavus]MDJ1469441.1 ThuA domain-containing protein [Xanthocytophaga flavus]